MSSDGRTLELTQRAILTLFEALSSFGASSSLLRRRRRIKRSRQRDSVVGKEERKLTRSTDLPSFG